MLDFEPNEKPNRATKFQFIVLFAIPSHSILRLNNGFTFIANNEYDFVDYYLSPREGCEQK